MTAIVLPHTISLHAIARAVTRTTLSAHELVELSNRLKTLDNAYVYSYFGGNKYRLVAFFHGNTYDIVYEARKQKIITFLGDSYDFGKLYDIVARTKNIYEIRSYAIKHKIFYIVRMADETIHYVQRYL